jgi:hypothetical protein
MAPRRRTQHFLCAAGVAAPIVAVAFGMSDAHAAMTISNAATRNVTCAAGVCTASAKNAVLNAGDLTGMLASSDVTLRPGRKAMDVNVKAALSWVSANLLTLDAYRSITFEKPVTVAGSGGLTLTTNDGGTGGALSFVKLGSVVFWDLSSSLIVDGNAYTLVGSIAALASDIAGNPSGNYALANSYDASVDGTYAAAPIPTALMGKVEGLGNTISNLSIDDPTKKEYVGLFAQVGPGGNVFDLNLTNLAVEAARLSQVGELVGYNSGTLSGDSASGHIKVHSSASQSGLDTNVGGLVGLNVGVIANSHARGTVDGGNAEVGGLVGLNAGGTITNSWASGQVSGSFAEGGLVGYSQGPITNSYAAGAVKGRGLIQGGLVGFNGATIGTSYATATVASSYLNAVIGGLVGQNDDAISDSYATGAVSGGMDARIGGLVGFNSSTGSTIDTSYSTGSVSAGSGSDVGGLIGFDGSSAGSVNFSYWDTDTSGISNLSQGAGNVSNDPGISGLTTSQLQSGLPAGFSDTVWAENAGINGGLPYLLSLPPQRFERGFNRGLDWARREGFLPND